MAGAYEAFAQQKWKYPAVEGAEGLAEVTLCNGENGTGQARVLAVLMGALGRH